MKKVLRTIAVILVTLIVLVLAVPVALYIPFVQDAIVGKTLTILNNNKEDLHYDIRYLRLRFPLEIELQDLLLSHAGDTVAYVHHLHTALDEFPWKENRNFVIHQVLVEKVRTGIDSTLVSGMELQGGIDTLRVREVVLCLDSNRVEVGDVLLSAPHFVVNYASDSTVVEEEEPDTTTSAPWRVALGALDITDVQVHYDVWRVDSLDLHLSQFDMDGLCFRLDTLTIDLPKSHIGLSTDLDLAYLNDSTQGRGQADMQLSLSREDLLHIVGEAFPDLSTYWPEQSDLTGAVALYLTPDTLRLTPLQLTLPGFVELTGRAEAVHPFDNAARWGEMSLQTIVTHADTLLTAIVGETRDYRLPDSLSLKLDAVQQAECYDAILSFVQDTTPRLLATATYNQQTEEYRTQAEVRHFFLSDYLPAQLVEEVNVRLQAEGQHFEFDKARTRLQAQLQLDTLNYRMEGDSSRMEIAVHDVGFHTTLANDSLRLHGDINFDMADVGQFDSLRLDFLNSPRHMELCFQAGDADLDVEAGCDIYQLMDVADLVMRELDMQTTNQAFDINALQRAIPSLALKLSMSQANPLTPLLKQQGVAFDSLWVDLTNTDSLRMQARIDTLQYEDISIARIGAHLSPSQGDYNYLADVLYKDTLTGMDFALGLKARLLSDSILAEGDLKADTMEVLTFDGCLTKRIRADIYLAALPLAVANGFVGDEVKLSGYLNGHARLDCDSVDFNALEAALWFDSAAVWYEGCDMTLGLPQDSIVYRNGQLLMDHIRFVTQNEQPIMIDGSVDLRKQMDNPDIDLMILSDNAQIIHNKRRKTKGQFLYGTLPLSTSVAVVGKLNDLKVTGQIAIPEGCNLTYFYEDNSVASSSQLTDLVEFVSFQEEGMADSLVIVENLQTENSGNMDVNLKLRIDPNTQVLVWLPTSSDDRVMIKGGGDLKMSMNENGDLQLSGGYNVTGGDINFKLPMLPVTKAFALTSGSWLRWSGIVDQPELNLTATENVKCTINDATSGARVVKFVVSILIRGTLENMEILFNCSAPDDAAIQSELSSLTEEERTKQALMLLVTQTYNGPSASAGSAGISSANAALSSMINKELESLLTNKLQHTEINVGIDTYDPNGTGAQQTDYSVQVSQKLFNDRMRVSVGGKMSTGDEVQQDNASIINDISLEWLIKPDASQFARVFRHINYESVLEGEVVETGLGYVQKRDAYKFWQLFLRSNKKREAARKEMLKKLQTQEIEKVREEAKKKQSGETQSQEPTIEQPKDE